jgi:competence transcription factor ComK
MAQFIELEASLREEDGMSVFINIDHIVSFHEKDGDKTSILLINGEAALYNIKCEHLYNSLSNYK